MKFRDCTSMNSTENIHEGYRNRLSKTVLGFKNCKQLLLLTIISSIRKKYRIASMFIITRAVSSPRDVERRESGSMFCETIEIISFSHDHIVKIKLPRQTQCKHGHRWLNLILFQLWERLLLRSWAKTTLLRQSAIFLNEQSKSCDSWLKRERGRNLRSPFAIIWKLSR